MECPDGSQPATTGLADSQPVTTGLSEPATTGLSDSMPASAGGSDPTNVCGSEPVPTGEAEPVTTGQPPRYERAAKDDISTTIIQLLQDHGLVGDCLAKQGCFWKPAFLEAVLCALHARD